MKELLKLLLTVALPEGEARLEIVADTVVLMDWDSEVVKDPEALIEPDWDPEFDWLREVE